MEATELLAGEQVRAAVPVQAIARGGRSRPGPGICLVFTRVAVHSYRHTKLVITIVTYVFSFSTRNSEAGQMQRSVRNAIGNTLIPMGFLSTIHLARY